MEKVRVQEGSGEGCEKRNGLVGEGPSEVEGVRHFHRQSSSWKACGVCGAAGGMWGGDEMGKMGSGPIPQGCACSAGDLTHY